ncbi:clavesin-1 [Periplaneta americana]|uniref:clavesin-1 n=1 Tax=Periplaneta americana TaxID=6978 RepID=UPI0037E76AF4
MTTTRVIMSYQWGEKPGLMSLKEEVARVASQELREDKATREHALEHFRAWIDKNCDLCNCRTDDNFLLRFLRVKKFSLPMAQQMLLKYINFRQTFSHLVYNLDYLSPSINELLTNGYIYVSPFKDSNGRRVVLYNINKFDPKKHTNADMTKAHMVTYEVLMEDEESQVMGFTHVGDMAEASAAQATIWSPTEFTTLVRWGEQSIPMRHKEIHLINVPAALRYLYDIISGLVSEKMRSRFRIHESEESLTKRVDPKVLPKELGGTMPMAEMIELWTKELANKRECILDLDNMKLLSTKSIITRRNNQNNENSSIVINNLQGSFRKLEVD